ncbi:hypothetical protein niasHS_016277 [Heterodera schachtii]|uniref:Uncharacterized protein n=1 Tax=Heterodera schachtii TaxID=97005 RepID=A0ABD2HZH4_HETSC
MDRPKRTPTNASTPEDRLNYRIEKKLNNAGCLRIEGENMSLEEIDQLIAQRAAASAEQQHSRRRPCVLEAPEAPPKPLNWKCNECPKAFPSPTGLHNHKRVHRQSPVRRQSTPTIDLSGSAETEEDLGTPGTSARIVETPGELVILKCVVEGNPAPKFAWKKGGLEVPLTDDRLRCQTDGDTRTRKAKAPLNVPGPPGPPKPLHTAYNSIMLLWAQPLRDGGTPITGYELEKREHGTNAQWENAAFGSVPDTQFKVTGVKQYHFYEFRVAAVNAVGQGEWSDNSVPIAAIRSSCKPLITMGMLARENDLGSDSVDLRLEVVDRPAPPEGSLKVLPELVVSKYQVPSQPDKPVVRDFGRTWAELEWELPASNGGAKIRGYELQHKEKHSEWITCKKSGTWATNFKVKNLIDRGEYQFRVAARNEAGLSKPSLPSDRIKLPGPPGMPIQVEAQSIGPNCVTLTWQPPAEDGGSKLEGYLVQKREWGHEQWEKATPDMCPLTECLVPGLREFQAYVFRVIAVNLHGRSTPSLHTLPINIVETAGACPTIVINKELSVQGPSVVPLKSQRANEKEKDATQIRTPKTAQPSSAHGIGPSLDSSDQPLSSTARRCQPRRQKSARKDATDIQCENLTPPRPKNTERTASSSGRRRVGSTAADRPAQAAAAARAGDEEAPDEVDKNEEKRQDMAVVTKRMAILDLSTSGTPARSQVSVVEEPFVVPLKSQRATEKENATFECYVNDKEIDVKWFHDGAKIGMDGRHIKQRAGCRRRLLITNALFEDHGEYKCTTKDDETMAQLIVDPKFVKKKRSASR